MSDVTRDLYELSNRFVDEVNERTDTDQPQSAEDIANSVIAGLPDVFQAKLLPVEADPELVEKARALYHAARPALEGAGSKSGDPLESAAALWMGLRGTLKAQRTEKMTIGQWLGESLLSFSEPMSASDVGDMLFECVNARLSYRGNNTADQVIRRSAGPFISEALKSLQGHDCFEDVKQACIEFRQVEKSLEPVIDDQELDL